MSTDGEYFGPAGDAFSVYPAPDGNAYESIRLPVFHDGLQDMRALEKCAQLYSKEYAIRLMEEDIAPISFSDYPHGSSWLLNMRERINAAIKEAVSK